MQFKDIIGHEDIKNKLINGVKNNRISHAQLFYGAEGTHKLALSIAYAQYIMCTNRGEHDSCGECPSCKKIEKLQHPDLHFHYPWPKKEDADYSEVWRKLVTQDQGHVSIEKWALLTEAENKQFTIYTDQTLALIHQAGIQSYESEYKIIIVWLIEKIYHGAVSKILKTLEEPNPKTIFLLVTEKYEEVISTIISRCQLVKLNKYPDNIIRNALIDQYKVETSRASEIARIADGNFVYALSLVEQGVDNQELTLFIELNRNAFNFFRTGTDFQKVATIVEQISKLGREKIKSFLEFSLIMYQQSLYLNTHTSEISRITNEESDFLKKFNQFVTPKNIETLHEETNKALFHIQRNGYATLVLTDYAMKIGASLKSNS